MTLNYGALHRQDHRVPHRGLRPVPHRPEHEPAEKEGRGARSGAPTTKDCPYCCYDGPGQGRPLPALHLGDQIGPGRAHEAQTAVHPPRGFPPARRPRDSYPGSSGPSWRRRGPSAWSASASAEDGGSAMETQKKRRWFQAVAAAAFNAYIPSFFKRRHLPGPVQGPLRPRSQLLFVPFGPRRLPDRGPPEFPGLGPAQPVARPAPVRPLCHRFPRGRRQCRRATAVRLDLPLRALPGARPQDPFAQVRRSRSS